MTLGASLVTIDLEFYARHQEMVAPHTAALGASSEMVPIYILLHP